MSVATATPLQAVRSAQADVERLNQRAIDLWALRYAWYALDDVHHDDINAMTNGINGGLMRRCKWQPITRAPRWVHFGALGSENGGEVVATRNPDPTTRRPREQMYWIKPAAVMSSLTMLYGERGMVDGENLRGVDLDTFEALRIDDLFFPENDASLPRTFRGCEARVIQQLQKLKRGDLSTPEWTNVLESDERKAVTPSYSAPVSSHALPSVIKIGEEMLGSLRRSARHGRIVIDEIHAEMEKARVDVSGRYRGTYDNRERRLLEWLEITPRNEALERMAVDANSLPTLVGQMANIVAAQAQNTQALDVSALGNAIGGALARELAPLMAAKQEAVTQAEAPAKESQPADEEPKQRKRPFATPEVK